MGEPEDVLLAQVRSRIGTSLCGGKYRLGELLGVGGMAAVYAATHRNGRDVAVKVLHRELSIRADIRSRFVREGQASNAVKHPGVVTIIDDDVAEDGSAFLVMELLAGQPVEAIWEQNAHRLPPKVVLAIGRELCEVLDVAHRAGIVHRDLKPANLFVTNEGKLKVLDFGIARVRDAARPSATHTGVVLGTPAFMAPEQALGRASEVDGRTDIWAVGATMFTLLSGSAVHVGETPHHVMMLSATRPAPSLAHVAPDFHPELVALVDRALAFDKGERWSTARSMCDAICHVSRVLFDTSVPQLAGTSDTLMVTPAPTNFAGTLSSPRASDRAESDVIGSTTSQPVSRGVDAPVRASVPNEMRAGTARKGAFQSILVPTVALGAILTFIAGWRLALLQARPPAVASKPEATEIPKTARAPAALTTPADSAPSGAATEPSVPPPDAPIAPPSPATATSAARATPVSPAAGAARLNCSPPFTIRNGIQVHKPGCP